MPVQKYNDQNSDLNATVFQRRWEANFHMAQAISLMQSLPALRGLWPFSATEAETIYDLSGEGRMLYLSGQTLANFGLVQYGDFDGVSDYATRPDETGLSVTGALSLGGWFYFDANGAEQGLISKWYSTGNQLGYALVRSAANAIVAEITTDGATGVFATSAAVASGGWHFCGFRFEPSVSLSVCVDRTWVDNVTAIPASIFASTENLDVGRVNRGSYFNGRACLLWLAADDLPKAEFAVIYEATRALFGV